MSGTTAPRLTASSIRLAVHKSRERRDVSTRQSAVAVRKIRLTSGMEGGRDACRAKQQTQTASDSDVGRGAVSGTQAETDVPKEEEELE